jgi:predicted porin
MVVRPGWSLKGQLGVASVRTRFDYATPFSGDVSKSTTQPLIGVSVGYDLTPNWRLSVDYDATRFKVHTTRGSLQMLGASAQYTF